MATRTLVAELVAKDDQFRATLSGAAQQVDRVAGRMNTAIAGISTGFKALGVTLAAGLGFAGLKNRIDESIESMAGLQDAAERTGASIEGLSALRNIASLSDTDFEGVITGLQRLAKAQIEAQNNSSRAAQAFKALGIPLADIARQAPDKLMLDIAIALDRFGDSAAKPAIQMALLGKAGANLGPVFNDLAEAGSLVGRTTAEQAKQSDEYQKNIARLSLASSELWRSLTKQLLPALTDISAEMVKAAEKGGILYSALIGIANVAKLPFNLIFDPDKSGLKEATNQVTQFQEQLRRLHDELRRAQEEQAARPSQQNRAAIEDINNQLLLVQRRLELARGQKTIAEQLEAGGSKPETKPLLEFKPEEEKDIETDRKALLEARIKRLDAVIAQERDLLRQRNDMIDLLNRQSMLSIDEYYQARAAAQQDALGRELAALDTQAAILRSAPRADTPRERADAEAKLGEVLAKRSALERDAAAQSIKSSIESEAAVQRFKDKLLELNLALAETNGLMGQTAGVRFDLQNAELARQIELNRSSARPDVSAAAADAGEALASLREQTVLRAGLLDSQREFERLTQDLQVAESRIALQRERGALTELESLGAISSARRDQLAALERSVVAYERLAAASADPEAELRAKELRLRLDELAAGSDLVADAFINTGKQLSTTFFYDLISRTKTVSEAFSDLGRSILNTFNRLIAEQLGQQLFRSLMPSGGQSSGGGQDWLGPLISAAFSAFGGGPPTGQLYASGGLISGPGSGRSDSIPAIGPGGKMYRLSNGEFIVREEVVRRPGMKEFLDWINESARGFANGGQVGSSPAAQVAGLARQPSVVINQSISVDSRSDQATILGAMIQAKEAAKREILMSMNRNGVFART